MSKKRWIAGGLIAVALIAIVVLIVHIMWPPANGARATKVKIGYIPFSNCLPFFVAVENGYFSKRGIDVEPVRCHNSSEALNALVAGEVDALAGVTFSTYWAAEQEQPGRLKLFLCHYETPDDPFSNLLVRKDSPLQNPTELRGKKVGTYTGVSQLLYLRLFLKKIGLQPDKDVQIVQVGSGLQIQALQARQFDALFTVEPYGTIAETKGIAKVLVASPRTRYIQNPFWGGASAVTADFLRDNKGVVSRLYEAMAEGVRFVRADVQKAKVFLPKYTPMQPDVAARSHLYKWLLMREPLDEDGLQKLADLMAEQKVLRRRIEATPMLLTPADIQ